MPYIDFCFMLIIIFVGMLSIAYFDPAGLTDMTVRADDTQDQSVGEYENMPRGVETRAHGTGGEAIEGSPRPLIGKDFSGGAVYPTPSPTPDAAPEFPTPDSMREPMASNHAQSGDEPGNASQKDLDAMRSRLSRLQSENQRLRRNQGAPGPGGQNTAATGQGAEQNTGTGTGSNTQQNTAPPGPDSSQEASNAPDKGLSDHLYLDLRTNSEQ